MADEKEIVKRFEDLRYSDDFVFEKVSLNRELTAHMLMLATDISIETILSDNVQKHLAVFHDRRSVRLDHFAESDEAVFNGEMENYSYIKKRDLPRRTRFYQGIVDVNILETGMLYYKLKDSYIIFVCTYDPFSKGYYRYYFENRCKGDTDLLLETAR